MSKISGKDVIVYLRTQASPEILKPICCSRSCTLNTQSATAGISTIGSGIWSEFKGLSMNWNMSVDGLATFGQNADIQTLRNLQFALTPVFLTFSEYAGGLAVDYAGNAIITSVQSTGSYADVETYSVQFQGTGELVITNACGNYPLLFQIIDVHPNTPIAGETTLDLVWDSANPVPLTYTVKIFDITSNTTTFVTGIIEIGHTVSIVVNSSHSYALSIQSVYDQCSSSFSPVINWP